ncbi:DUF1330 domain-containing protein [uncultured Roseobacter sp.]|uniref:DUF1330 domain-containing protein n=1 Tax=uncultured Roseobacter sp. TaxID=114847 RepID=UPI00262D651A|nr:DUF1330 domain-containing protein [uncultured Roseobacter sp.]
MSKGYWVVRVSVKNADNYPAYLAAAKPAFEKFKARFLVRGGKYTAPEGTPRDRNVVVEFQDYDTALACYQSPEYQRARDIRMANAETDFLIVEGGRG